MATTDEEQVRALVENWAAAVHAGDLETTLASHTDDIVMFDVPEPHDGVRGLAAYRATWPPFHEWQASGASFAIVELHVETSGDLGFAWALLRCGMPDDDPDRRLRLTLGLRRASGEWSVAHEHHSFALASDQRSAEQVRAVHEDWFAATVAKDIDGIVAHVSDDVVSYEHDGEATGADEVRAACAKGLDHGADVAWTVPDLQIHVREDLAVAWGHNRMEHDGTQSSSRGTRVFRRRAGGWELLHQHVSFPGWRAPRSVLHQDGRMPNLLDESAITAALETLTAWERDGDALRRVAELPSFPAAIAVVDRVADIAERADHHPDIDIRWRKLTFRCSTHSAGGVTDLDIALATAIDEQVAAAGG